MESDRERRMRMKEALQWAAAGTLFTFTMTGLGAGMVFFLAGEHQRRWQRWMLGFAAGVMTAASVWSLLLPAIERSEGLGLPGWLPAAAGTAAGAVFLAGMELLLEKRQGDHEGALLVAAITVHNIPEGMAVGLACALAAEGDMAAGAAALALGVGLQNFPEGAAVSLPLVAGKGRKKAFGWGLLSGVVEPVCGLAAVVFAAVAMPAMPWLLSFAAGAMLYVVAQELVPQARGWGGTCGYMMGFILMMVMDTALG